MVWTARFRKPRFRLIALSNLGLRSAQPFMQYEAAAVCRGINQTGITEITHLHSLSRLRKTEVVIPSGRPRLLLGYSVKQA